MSKDHREPSMKLCQEQTVIHGRQQCRLNIVSVLHRYLGGVVCCHPFPFLLPLLIWRPGMSWSENWRERVQALYNSPGKSCWAIPVPLIHLFHAHNLANVLAGTAKRVGETIREGGGMLGTDSLKSASVTTWATGLTESLDYNPDGTHPEVRARPPAHY